MRDGYVEIDLFDLCREILKKWKIILACMLICALIGGLIGFLNARRPKPNDEAIVKQLTESLSKEDREKVENAASVLKSYNEMYVKQKEYNENSIYQNLDAYNVKTQKLSYYVDNHYQVSYPIIEGTNNLIPIVAMYTLAYTNDALYADLAKEFGISDPVYIRELIVTNTSDEASGLFTVTVYAETDEMLTAITNLINTAIEDEKADVTAIYGDHDIILSKERPTNSVSTAMADAQKLNMERMTSITTDSSKLESSFSGDQKAYLDYLVYEKVRGTANPIKNAIAGAMLGAILAAAYVIFKYATSDSVKTERELTRYLGADSLGRLDEGESLLAARINSVVSANNFMKVAIICSEETDVLKDIAARIKPEAVLIKDLLSDKDAFEEFASCDAAVPVEEVRVSDRKDVINRKQMCDGANIKLLGVLLK